MAKQNINVGTTANDKKGDSLRAAFVKVNANFTELYTELGLINDVTLSLGAFEFAGSTISTTDSTAIVIDQAATITSNLSVGGDIVPQTANGGDLGSSTLPWRSLYVSNNTIYIGGTAVGVDANGNLTVNGGQVNTPSSTLVNGAYTASLGSDGSLTLPPTGTLSTGTIYFNGSLQTGSQTQYQFEAIVTGEGEEAVYSSKLSLPNIAEIFAGEDLSLSTWGSGVAIKVRNPSDFSDHTWSFDNNGSLTLPGALTFPSGGGNIRSDGNINIDINLADSTLRRWQFGEDGALTLPSVGKINNGAYDWTFGSTGNTTFPTGLTLGAPRGVGTVNFTAAVDKEFQIETGTATSGKLWQFGTDGSLKIPGDIKSDSNINIEVNLSDSTLRRWQFGEDGDLVFPDGTVQNTAWTGIPGPYADDEAATLAGVALGSPYHKTGTGGQVFVRLTSPT